MFITVLLCLSVINISPVFSDEYVPCDRGWYYFRDKCYRVGARKASERLSWSRALTRCKSYGADLASIHSQEEQDFIVAFLLLDVKSSVWIGLNDQDKEGTFTWIDGSAFNYSNWNPGEPSAHGNNEHCVHILFYPHKWEVGKWNDMPCETTQAYICEKNTNPRKRSPNLMFCSSEEGRGWKYQSSCYHLVREIKTWQNAERHCKNYYDGHLLTIRDMLEDYFLEIATEFNNKMWIGIKIKDQLQQKWTSGWYVSYERFNNEEKYVQDTCVARKNRKEWMTLPCTEELPFICEVSKASPPVLKMLPIGAHCPKELDDWRDLGGEYCYYIDSTKEVNFNEARFHCTRRGGDLVSLHSQEESDILQPFVRYKREKIFIGLVRLLAYNEEIFAWIDGSKLDYQNWHPDEPDKEEEKCVGAVTESMKWYDFPCEDKGLGYICSVKKIVPNRALLHENANCKNFCIAPSSYLYGILIQCPDAKETSCKTR